MLLVDFNLKIGYMWKTDSETNLKEEYIIYYSPNALFAICDLDKNLISFAADESHLKNLLGKSKGYHTNLFEGFSFTFTYYDSQWFKKPRMKEIFKAITRTFTNGKITNYFKLTYL